MAHSGKIAVETSPTTTSEIILYCSGQWSDPALLEQDSYARQLCEALYKKLRNDASLEMSVLLLYDPMFTNPDLQYRTEADNERHCTIRNFYSCTEP